MRVPKIPGITGRGCEFLKSTNPSSPGREMPVDGDFTPASWLEVSEMHEDFWRKVRPMVSEMERLRRKYGKRKLRNLHGIFRRVECRKPSGEREASSRGAMFPPKIQHQTRR